MRTFKFLVHYRSMTTYRDYYSAFSTEEGADCLYFHELQNPLSKCVEKISINWKTNEDAGLIPFYIDKETYQLVSEEAFKKDMTKRYARVFAY